jgi:hypothetical protein
VESGDTQEFDYLAVVRGGPDEGIFLQVATPAAWFFGKPRKIWPKEQDRDIWW